MPGSSAWPPPTCCGGRRERDVGATGRPAASMFPLPTRMPWTSCASCCWTRSACACVATSRSAPRSAAESILRRSWPYARGWARTRAATPSPRPSPATSATSGAMPHRSRRAADVVEHHRAEPTSESWPTMWRRWYAGRRSRSARPRSMPSGGSTEARRVGVVVLLDGQGADELFGGYPWMVGPRRSRAGRGGCARAARRPQALGALRAVAGAYLRSRWRGSTAVARRARTRARMRWRALDVRRRRPLSRRARRCGGSWCARRS